MTLETAKIAVIGLGYVGLPLAIEFARYYPVTGYDIQPQRIQGLNQLVDTTLEADLAQLKEVIENGNLLLSSDPLSIEGANIYIVTVPTPVDLNKMPDLKALLEATATVGKVLKKGDMVIYESTVYPGCTEEDCVPVLERTSGLKYNIDFFCGYSPERINPGDKVNTLTKIKKVTSGSTPESADLINRLYQRIITAGTHLAPSIKVAEASKAIENAQRDVNISFVNELALMFDKMGVDTADVLEAAATKWNFLKYTPGLVGGHCIGVDPYYLTYKARLLGYQPQVILSGRNVNEQMGIFIASKVVKLMLARKHAVNGERALILGFTFKENCPDIRNTRVIDIYHELSQYGLQVDVYDPWVNPEQVDKEYNIRLISNLDTSVYKAVILAVAHHQFKDLNYQAFRTAGAVIFDTKSCLERGLADARL